MQSARQNLISVAAAALVVGAGALLERAGWLPPQLSVALSGMLAAAILAARLESRQAPTDSWATPPISFVVDFASLLLLGPALTLLVVAAGVLSSWLLEVPASSSPRRLLWKGATTAVALQAAGLAYQMLGGARGHFAWPWHALPAAAAVVGYCLVQGCAAEVLVPLLAKRSPARSWPWCILRGTPGYFLCASVAVGFAEVVDRGLLWQVAPAAILPLHFAYRAYCTHLDRVHEERRREDVVDYLEEGMSVLDRDGRITVWNDALQRMLACPRERALDRTVDAVVPAFANTELTRTIADVLAGQSRGARVRMRLASNDAPRMLQVTILPVADGATLLWHDVTVLTQKEDALRRSEARLALTAQGANDGLWEWDLRSQAFYVSPRWQAMLGLPTSEGVTGSEAWMDRVHPDDLAALKDALRAHLSGSTEHFQHEHRIRHEDGTYRRVLSRGLAMRGAGRQPSRIAGSLTDITEREAAEERLRVSGALDALTGLSTRALFVEGLGRRLQAFKQRPDGSRLAVLYLDLDRFKVINDSLGHMVGDELLTAVSRRLESCLRPGDTIARLGGDEFSILLHDLGDDNQANAVAFRIQEALSPAFAVGGREVFTSASIGIAPVRTQYNHPEEIMRDADTAMYHAKSRGKARHEIFDAEMHARELDRLGLENDLRRAVQQDECEVYYQPIVSLASGRCIGFESLVRWTRNGTPVSPAKFVPIAEELGLIDPLGTKILREACAVFADWQRRFPDRGLDYITVNVSSRQLKQQHFLSIVEDAVHSAGLQPRDLRLEITETALMDNPQEVAELLQRLRDFGVKIYLDDFGTGYSSLTHLHKLPVDALKIDCSFVKSLLLPDRPAIVESILALARTLKTGVVAEGIESEVQARELERLGCTNAQGFLFSRPIPAGAAEALLVANVPLGPQGLPPTAPGDVNLDPGSFYTPSTRFVWPEALLPA